MHSGTLPVVCGVTVMVEEVAIVHSAPSRRAGRHWGDTHFSEGLASALARAGAEPHVLARDERERSVGRPTVVVRGLFPYLPAGGSPRVLWVINHADRVTDEELAAFDHVCVASSIEAERFRERTQVPVHVLHQATDPWRFRPPGLAPTHAASGVIVVANNRWPGRRAPRWLRQLGVDFSLYGLKWGGTAEERYVAAQHVPNDRVAGLYATAEIVVADQWAQMSAAGFVANRLFDVAAAGGFVISDWGPGVDEVFGGLVPTFDSRQELARQLDRWGSDPVARRTRAEELKQLVLAEHCFDHRAATLQALLG